ncbi:hypothetical protein [Streptantibioticus ferralitis]|uniref:Uncharacterized protein n=1 Tax=Streptantibioticus ferralitis TaxID=236510 RepID=A0ABT5Z2F2_9ACTN|nr:hypothetical protein [Streptantibioticus ferralitis]MDF2258019.1 hypothetical protein [Streptantibioticus ferralitis]
MPAAYEAAREEHRYWRPGRIERPRRPARWCDGFTLVADLVTEDTTVVPHDLPPQEPERI